jgi:hypothetical protein
MRRIMFKKGDKVRCIKVEYGNETLGKIYTIERDYILGALYIRIEKDDKGNKNSYHPQNFELYTLYSTGEPLFYEETI